MKIRVFWAWYDLWVGLYWAKMTELAEPGCAEAWLRKAIRETWPYAREMMCILGIGILVILILVFAVWIRSRRRR